METYEKMRTVYDQDGDKTVINVMNLLPLTSSHKQYSGANGVFVFQPHAWASKQPKFLKRYKKRG